ncbi:MAG: hypothetical protein BGO08_12680 [Altererythrobacter sp. 66-12]|nr:MAG: hypothetical protein BGO08_12680 [Altererythrobacter sp. 66-12]
MRCATCCDTFVGRRIVAWIDIRTQVVAGDAEQPFSAEDILRRHFLRLIDDAPHGGLRDAEQLAQFSVGTRLVPTCE